MAKYSNPFLVKQLFKNKKLKYALKKFPFINFENPLYFEVRKGGLGGSTFQYPSDWKFMFLKTSWYREWDQGVF